MSSGRQDRRGDLPGNPGHRDFPCALASRSRPVSLVSRMRKGGFESDDPDASFGKALFATIRGLAGSCEITTWRSAVSRSYNCLAANPPGMRTQPCEAGYPGSSPACMAMPLQVRRCMNGHGFSLIQIGPAELVLADNRENPVRGLFARLARRNFATTNFHFASINQHLLMLQRHQNLQGLCTSRGQYRG